MSRHRPRGTRKRKAEVISVRAKSWGDIPTIQTEKRMGWNAQVGNPIPDLVAHGGLNYQLESAKIDLNFGGWFVVYRRL